MTPEMPPGDRLSRGQTQARTRTALLDAAQGLLLSQSVEAVSIRSVCAAAGYTQGAFYSNFSSKDDLLLDLMQRNLQREADSLADALSLGSDDLDQRLGAIAQWLASVGGRAEWALVAIDLRLHAARNPAFAARMLDAQADLVDRFATHVQSLIDAHHLNPAFSGRQIAAAMLALWRALAVQQTRPGEDQLPAEAIMLTCLRAMMGMA